MLTPPVVSNPGMEVHIHPFQLTSAKTKELTNQYLHTSPEFAMKKILADSKGLKDIFTITYAFRDEPASTIHRNQFLMCEWYRKDCFYTQIMDDCESLIQSVHKYLEERKIPTIKLNFPFKRMTIQELFIETIGIDILNYLEKEKLRDLIKVEFKSVPLPKSELEWDDYYFLLFLNEVEPKISKYPYLLLYNFPSHLKALSTINKTDSRVCDRFEIYMNGVELCNCFNELTDLDEQKDRFKKDSNLKSQLYNYTLPSPEVLLMALKKGIPPSSGIALGVERLYKALTNEESIFFDEL